jgi:hypothetical protein
MNLNQLVGKIISEVHQDVYCASMNIKFNDGTVLNIGTGSDGMHNDRWSTVEYEIISDVKDR